MRGFLIGLLLLLGCNAVYAQESLDNARRLLKQGKEAEAREQVDAVLAKSPGQPQARFLKGLLLTQTGQLDEAIAVFEELTETHPDLPEPYNNLAVIYGRKGLYDKARRALELSLRRNPGYATAWVNLGDVYSQLASQAYAAAARLSPEIAAELSRKKPAPAASRENAPATAPAPAAPVAPPADTAAPASDPAAAALAVLRDWAAAWTRKDASAYLAFYDASFTPPGGKTRAAWESERRQRLSRPGDIRVEVNQPTVELTSPERASLRFTQRYSSTTLNESTSKQLELRLRGTQWKIMSEKTQPN